MTTETDGTFALINGRGVKLKQLGQVGHDEFFYNAAGWKGIANEYRKGTKGDSVG
jgi:hypothetical protein